MAKTELKPHLFKPGQSGNPNGRPKGHGDVQQLARQHTPAAIAALVAALGEKRERVSAAVALLDRGWGKPMQTLQAEGGSNVQLHLIAAQLVSAELTQRIADAAPVRTIDAEPEPQGNLLDAPPPTE